MRLFELLPHLDLPRQRSLTVTPPIEVAVKQALSHLEQHPSSRWRDAIRDLESGCPVRVEISLEELALLLERVDYSSGQLEDIEAMRFWDHLQASSEFLEALGYEWTNQFGFDCHESFTLAWFIPEAVVGYLAWLARFSRSTAWLPEELRYFDPRGKLINIATRLMNGLAAHVNQPTCHPALPLAFQNTSCLHSPRPSPFPRRSTQTAHNDCVSGRMCARASFQ